MTKLHLNRTIRFKTEERYRIAKELRDEKEEEYRSDQKGKNNQRRLSCILNRKPPIWFRRIYRPGKEFDSKGIDFFLDVYLSNYSVKTIRIQVKSSKFRALEFIEFGIAHELPKMAVITVNDDFSDEAIIYHLKGRVRKSILGRIGLLGDPPEDFPD